MAPKKSVEERRVDPDDGCAYTFEEMADFYKGKYKKVAIQAYWDECAPAKAAKAKAKVKAKAKAKEPAAEPKAKAKAKAKVKAKAKPELKAIRKPRDPAEVLEIVKACKVIPVVKLEDVAHAVPFTNALKEGGINVSEITFRSDCAAACIKEVAEKCEGVCVGAGTVLTVAQVDEAIEYGADFIVSPGFDPAVAARCRKRGALYLPGAVTPTEVMTASSKFNLKVLKFFPAGNYGGAGTLKSFSAVFPEISFMPTGGVTEANLGDYLSLPNVFACGGSWMANGSDILKAAESGDWSKMAEVAKSASAAAQSVAKK